MKFHDVPELFKGLLPLTEMFLVSPCVLVVVGAVQMHSEQTAVRLKGAHLSDLVWCLSDPFVGGTVQLALLTIFFAGGGGVYAKIYLFDSAVVCKFTVGYV